MSEQLYNFLLIDEEKLQESGYFEEYSSKGMYLKLRNKYVVMLSTLEYLQNIAQMKVEEMEQEKENQKSLINEQNKQIEEIKEEYKFGDSDIELFERVLDGKATDREVRMLGAFTDEEKSALNQIIRLTNEKKGDVETYEICKSAVKNIKLLKSIFYRSYGFNEKYEQGIWINSCEKQTQFLICLLERVYVYEESRADDDDYIGYNHLFVFELIAKFLHFYNMYLERDNRLKEIQVKNRSTVKIDDEIKFIEFIQEMEEEHQEKGLRSSFLPIFNKILHQSESEAGLYAQFFPSETYYIKYLEETKKLRELINEYNACFNSKKLENVEETQRRIIKAKIEEKQDRIYAEMIQVLKQMLVSKNSAGKRVRTFFERESKYVKKSYYKTIDGRLYSKLFCALRKEIREKFEDSDEEDVDMRENSYYIKQNRNGVYLYEDKLIITLNFPNTEIERYKTAAIILDSDKLNWVYKDSSNAAWTYRHGRKASSKEYDKKTWKPDKVTINNGKTDLAKMLYGDIAKEEKAYYITESHKFDFRCSNIKKVNKLLRKPDQRYHQGKIRLDEENYTERVCINLEKNITDASILYFDDMQKFREFLDEI